MALFRHVAAGTFPGEIWTFTLHSQGVLSISDAADAFETASGTPFWTVMAPHVCTDVVMTRATTISLNESTGQQINRQDRPVNRPGTSVADCLPFQVTPVVSLRSDTATKRGRGRFYFPSLAVDAQAGGTLVGAVQTDLADAAQAMLLQLQTAGLQPVLLSRDTMTQRDVVSIDVGSIIDTQRRRRNQLTETRTSRLI